MSLTPALYYDYRDMYVWPFLHIIYHNRGGKIMDGNTHKNFNQSVSRRPYDFNLSLLAHAAPHDQALYILYF